MIMSRHERWLDARPAEFASHKPCGRAFPDCVFAVPVASRNTRIVIWEVDEAGIPTEFVKTRSTAAIPNVTRGHERVQHEHRRCTPAAWAWEEIRARDIVGRKICNDRAAPGNCWAGSIADCTCNFSAV